MNLRLQNFDGNCFDLGDFSPSADVDKLKSKVQVMTGVRPSEQTLMFNGQTIDAGVLKDYGITSDCTIIMGVSSVGGK